MGGSPLASPSHGSLVSGRQDSLAAYRGHPSWSKRWGSGGICPPFPPPPQPHVGHPEHVWGGKPELMVAVSSSAQSRCNWDSAKCLHGRMHFGQVVWGCTFHFVHLQSRPFTFHDLHHWTECEHLKVFLRVKRRCIRVQFCNVYTTTDLCRGGEKDMLLPIQFYTHACIPIRN